MKGLRELDRVLRGEAVPGIDGRRPTVALVPLLTVNLLLAAFYDVCMGVFGLTGRAEPEFRQVLADAFKVPLLFLLTLFWLGAPPVHRPAEQTGDVLPRRRLGECLRGRGRYGVAGGGGGGEGVNEGVGQGGHRTDVTFYLPSFAAPLVHRIAADIDLDHRNGPLPFPFHSFQSPVSHFVVGGDYIVMDRGEPFRQSHLEQRLCLRETPGLNDFTG